MRNCDKKNVKMSVKIMSGTKTVSFILKDFTDKVSNKNPILNNNILSLDTFKEQIHFIE